MRPLLLVLLLALAVPAAALPTPLAAVTDERAPDGFAIGNPLLHADPLEWLPIVRSQGYAQAAQAMSQPESMPASSGAETAVEHWFMPLGDANGNGRDDVVLATSRNDTITYEALDGGRVGEVLWTFQVPDDEYAYLAGDVDEDGIYDLEHVVDHEMSGSEDESGDSWEQSADINILSGRDLAAMLSVRVSVRYAFDYSQPEPLPVGQSRISERYEFEYVHDLPEQPGLMRVTQVMEFATREERVLITTDGEEWFNYSATMALLDPSGALVWNHDEAGWALGYGWADATGDGVRDVLMRTKDYDHYQYSTLDPQIPVPDPLDLGLNPAEEPRAPYLVRLVDGASGEVVWEQPFGDASYSYTEWLGDVRGEGPVLFLYTLEFSMEDYDYSEHWYLINGKTGAIVHDQEGSMSLADLGDANRDGRDDLLTYDFNDSTLRLAAVDGDFNPLWDIKVSDDELAAIYDLTGDDVLDILTVDDRNLTLLSGNDAQPAWERYEKRLADFDIAPGIVDDSDRELALLLSDAKDHEGVAEHPADLLMLRGSDGAPLWRKPIYDPKDYEKVNSDDAWLWVSSAGDLNGDGANDFILDLEQMDFIIYSTSCFNDECETDIEDTREDDDGQRLNFVALVDGATGATVTRFDDMVLAPKVKVVEEAPVDIKPAAEELVQQNAPGPALWAILAAIGAALVVIRRKA